MSMEPVAWEVWYGYHGTLPHVVFKEPKPEKGKMIRPLYAHPHDEDVSESEEEEEVEVA